MISFEQEKELQRVLDLCKVEEIANGHKATFRGQSFIAQETGGPNKFTQLLAKKGAIFCWALEERRKEQYKYGS